MYKRPCKRIKRIESNGRIRWIEIDLYLHSFINSNYSSKTPVQEDITEQKEINELISLVIPEDDINRNAFLNRIADSIIEIGKLMDNELSIESAVEEIIEKQNLKFNIPAHKEKFISILKQILQ